MENLVKLLVLAPEELDEEQQLAAFIGILTDEPPMPLAKKLLESFGSLKALLAADYGMLNLLTLHRSKGRMSAFWK